MGIYKREMQMCLLPKSNKCPNEGMWTMLTLLTFLTFTFSNMSTTEESLWRHSGTENLSYLVVWKPKCFTADVRKDDIVSMHVMGCSSEGWQAGEVGLRVILLIWKHFKPSVETKTLVNCPVVTQRSIHALFCRYLRWVWEKSARFWQ